LRDAEIALGYSFGAMVINFHDDGQTFAVFPRLIAESFAEAVRTYAGFNINGFTCGAD
jgi:hypothetical protein